MTLFDINLPRILNKELGSLLLRGTLTKTVEGSRDSNDLLAGPSVTTTTHSFNGFIGMYSEYAIATTEVQAGDLKIMILANSLSGVVPAIGDKLTIDGGTYTIAAEVVRDPAKATYECRARAIS